MLPTLAFKFASFFFFQELEFKVGGKTRRMSVTRRSSAVIDEEDLSSSEEAMTGKFIIIVFLVCTPLAKLDISIDMM
jgi:hypothetical protein